jgi:hypothetical protein
LGDDLDHRRQRHADSLEHRAGAASGSGADAQPSASLINVGLNELIEIANDIGPFEPTPVAGDTVDQFLAQQQSKERTEGVVQRRVTREGGLTPPGWMTAP